MPKILDLPSHAGAIPATAVLVLTDPTESIVDNRTKKLVATTFALSQDLTALESAVLSPPTTTPVSADFLLFEDISETGLAKVAITDFITAFVGDVAGDDLGSATALDVAALFTGTGTYLKSDGTLADPSLEAGTMVYPASGVARSNGTGWTTSYQVGIGANNLVQLTAAAQLPAVSAALLTNFPTLNQDTTGTASNVTGTVAVANGGTGSPTADGARSALGVTGIIGIGTSDTTLGSFTGTTIPDAQTIKQAIQVLEAALEAFDTNFLRSTDNVTITGSWTFQEEITLPANQTLPAGGTLNQILVMGESGPVWMDVEDHPSDIITGEPTPV